MALTPTSVTRTDDASGDDFLTFDTGGAVKAQGMVVVDENGAHTGVPGNALEVGGTVAVSGTVTTAPNQPATKYSSGGTTVIQAQAKSGSGVLRSAMCTLDPSVLTDRWLMFFDQTAALTGAEVPMWQVYLPAGGSAFWEPANGESFSTGLRIGISTTPGVFTLPAGNEGFINVRLD